MVQGDRRQSTGSSRPRRQALADNSRGTNPAFKAEKDKAMRTAAGRVIRIAEENQPVPGCTISEQIFQDDEKSASVFSLAEGTSISAESYGYHKLLTVYTGTMEVFTSEGASHKLNAGESLITELNIPVGTKTDTGCVYTEIGLPKETAMNQILKAGNVFALKDLLPYQEGRIVNMDLIHEKNLKFVLMSFDAGTGLSEHAAPGEALVFALDGEAIIGYEGREHTIKAGEVFKFDKMGRHSVKANGRFKMALLLVLE